jgi:uncharacterized membrane protein YphA (DoxX/SURF4 family)
MLAVTGRRSPARVCALLSQLWVGSLVRLALESACLIGGIDKVLNFSDAIAEPVHFGLRPTAFWAALAVVVEIAGSLRVVSRRFTGLGAGGLGTLTLVAMVVANDFWNQTGVARS